MSKNNISEPHRATIKRHWEESLAEGLPLEEIHDELMEVFAYEGRYSLRQIESTIKWLKSPNLMKKRAKPIPMSEDTGKTNEDVDFDNPEKNECRMWHVNNVLKHTTLEQRRAMRFSLLPGRNTYDFDALQGIGMECRNFLTFILGNDPKSVAQYIRNCRRYGVVRRRIGKIIDLIDEEPSDLQGVYWDYFGQFCDTSLEEVYSLPLDPDCYPICLGFNLLKGRESGDTQEKMCRLEEVKKIVTEMRFETRQLGFDYFKLSYGTHVKDETLSAFEIAEVRNQVAQEMLFTRAGVANTKNWVSEEWVKKLLQDPYNHQYDCGSNIQKYDLISDLTQDMVLAAAVLERKQQLEPMGMYFNMSALALGVMNALMNRPIVREVEEPKEYQSAHSSQPFVSYFAVLETRRKHYVQYIEAMEFFFKIMDHTLKPPRYSKDKMDFDFKRLGSFKCIGSGKYKEVIFMDENQKTISHINHDFLVEAAYEFHISMDSCHFKEKVNRQEMKEGAILMSHMHDMQNLQSVGIPNATQTQQGTIRNTGIKKGRNEPCYCGSGKKFKRCCAAH